MAEVVVKLTPNKSGVTLEISAAQLSVASLALGPWPSQVQPELVNVPYYSMPIRYLRAADLFANLYFDWQHSNATRLTNDSAVYESLTTARRNNLHERIVARVSSNLQEILPDVENPKSPYITQLAGRIVIDVWGPRFSTIADTLTKLRQAGLKDCVVLIHVWQQKGYDNGLPGHYPANTALGGASGLSAAVAAGKEARCYVGLHENYVDYYPNYDGFDLAAIALNSQGKQQLAWLNPATHTQSFASKPSVFSSIASTQSPEIHRRYQTTASFIDVNSAVPPWWRADMDAAAPGAGLFSTFVRASTDLWNLERKSHAGPVFGEGNNHWFWSGLIDGVEAQFGAEGIKASGPQMPLFVDFDLLKIHPLQVNHGMGYYERWVAKGDDIQQTALLDSYRMQEVIYGHAPFIGAKLSNSIPHVLLEQNLVGPVASRYGTRTATSIRYEVRGDWGSTESAIKARDFSRVQVKYSNGDTIVANAKPDTLKWENIEIPESGWVAKGIGLLAYTALKNGQLADYSETSTSFFANARNQADIQHSGLLAKPELELFEQTADATARIQLKWTVLDYLSGDLMTFIHFLAAKDGNSEIAFQADHWPSIPTGKWKPGQTVLDPPYQLNIPHGSADGVYSMRIGLYEPTSGDRARLLGRDDGESRYVLGNLTVSERGRRLHFDPAPVPTLSDKDHRLNFEGKVVDFGAIRTDGMVSLTRGGSGWILRVYPNTRDVTVQLNAAQFQLPAVLTCDSGPGTIQHPHLAGGYWQVHTEGSHFCQW
jgi:hypothetical protein